MNLQYADFEWQLKHPPGGDLLDIQVPGIDRDGWRTLLRLIVAEYPYKFGVIRAGTPDDRNEQPLPDDPMTLVTFADDGPWPWLEFSFGTIPARVHFIAPDCVEISFRRYALNAGTFPHLLELLGRIGASLDRDVLLMEENNDELCLMLFDNTAREIRRPHSGRSLHLPTYVLSLLSLLEQERGLCVEEHRTDSASFGDTLVVLRGDHLRVRIVRDRGDWFIEAGSAQPPEGWYDMSLLREQINDHVRSDVMSFDQQAAFLRTNWKQIVESLSGPNSTESQAAIERRRQNRLK